MILRKVSQWIVNNGFLATTKKKRLTTLQAIAKVRGEPIHSQHEFIKQLRNESINLHNSPFPLVDVQPSTLRGAGRGIFATSHLKAGTLAATYGGKYIPPIPICGSSEPLFDEPQLLIDIEGDYIICCEGGGWIDGKDSLQNTQGQHCVMQLVNHSSRPNATSVTIPSFPSNLGLSMPPAGTPWYFSPRDGATVALPERVSLKGQALVTLRNVAKGEELFYDYGLNPPEHWPEWYEPVKEDYLESLVANSP